jgi:hypothetical protein
MTVDMTNNRVPYGLLTDEEKAALHEHEKAGGEFEAWLDVGGWLSSSSPRYLDWVYRTAPLPKTQDVIAWDRLPDWVEWVARDEIGMIFAFSREPRNHDGIWSRDGHDGIWSRDINRRIDDFPGIVQIGTVDWTESKQRRPK